MPAGPVKILDSTIFKDTNLKYYWTLDGSSGATTGSQDGTDTSITYETETPFISGSSALLNARTDKITFGTVFAPRATDGTIYAWVYPTSNGVQGDADYKFTSWYSKGDVYGRLGHIADNKIRIYYYDGAAAQKFESTGSITVNQWNQVVYTWTNGSSKIYINGTLDSTNNSLSFYGMDAGGDGGENAVGLGPEVGALNYGYLGYVDDLAFFDKQLTSNEISALYFSPDTRQKLQMII